MSKSFKCYEEKQSQAKTQRQQLLVQRGDQGKFFEEKAVGQRPERSKRANPEDLILEHPRQRKVHAKALRQTHLVCSSKSKEATEARAQ